LSCCVLPLATFASPPLYYFPLCCFSFSFFSPPLLPFCVESCLRSVFCSSFLLQVFSPFVTPLQHSFPFPTRWPPRLPSPSFAWPSPLSPYETRTLVRPTFSLPGFFLNFCFLYSFFFLEVFMPFIPWVFPFTLVACSRWSWAPTPPPPLQHVSTGEPKSLASKYLAIFFLPIFVFEKVLLLY